MRVGDYRVLYWQPSDGVYEVERIVHRRDLDAAAANLPRADLGTDSAPDPAV
jgi:hypothetical protein